MRAERAGSHLCIAADGELKVRPRVVPTGQRGSQKAKVASGRSVAHGRGGHNDVALRVGSQEPIERSRPWPIPEDVGYFGEHGERGEPIGVTRQIGEVPYGHLFELPPGGVLIAEVAV